MATAECGGDETHSFDPLSGLGWTSPRGWTTRTVHGETFVGGPPHHADDADDADDADEPAAAIWFDTPRRPTPEQVRIFGPVDEEHLDAYTRWTADGLAQLGTSGRENASNLIVSKAIVSGFPARRTRFTIRHSGSHNDEEVVGLVIIVDGVLLAATGSTVEAEHLATIDSAIGSVCVVVTPTAGDSGRPSNSAGNEVYRFCQDLGHDFERAYSRLCRDLKAQHDVADFEGSRGVIVSPIMATMTWNLDVEQDPPDIETLSAVATRATRAVTVERLRNELPRVVPEHWQIELVREDGLWRLCSFEQR